MRIRNYTKSGSQQPELYFLRFPRRAQETQKIQGFLNQDLVLNGGVTIAINPSPIDFTPVF